VDGGAERAASVLQGLEALQSHVQAGDFVLVHDAVRPCVAQCDIQRLMESLEHEPAGGLLASPLRDTLKRVDAAGYVVSTADRRGLWSAATPQMFRYGVLLEALRAAQRAGVMVTDEAQAVEQLGHRVLVVAGRADNIKVTFPEDLPLVERLLQGGADATADR
jgi:2-C-methyl-D-erythritol 4-phosphate cytidylyltransferase